LGIEYYSYLRVLVVFGLLYPFHARHVLSLGGVEVLLLNMLGGRL
jgi:hypothetical protein